MSRSPEAVIRAFCACWSRLDLDEIMAFFADDASTTTCPDRL